MNRTAKTVIAVQAVIIAAFVAFVAWAALSDTAGDIVADANAETVAATAYPGIEAGSSDERFIDALHRDGIPIGDPAQAVATGAHVCQLLGEGDNDTAFGILKAQGYGQIAQTKFATHSIRHICLGK